jgi:PAS domain S-box-containing protein
VAAALLARPEFNRVLRRTLIVPLCLLILSPFAFIWFGRELLAATQMDRHSIQVIGKTFEIEKLLVDLETGIRGYQLNGDQRFLEPYSRAEAVVGVQFDELQKLVSDKPTQLQQARVILEDHTRWEAFAAEAIRQVQAGRPADVRFNLDGKALMDRTRADTDIFLSAEQDLLAQRSSRVGSLKESTIETSALVFIVTTVAAALWVVRQMRQLRGSYADALAESNRQAESFRVTLASIGDAVIVTDRDGHVTFMNGEAERLTGWRVDEARTRPLKTVFRIVNEESREAVDDPVERVFRENRVVGLANHTALISKDGTEWLIEDSAAPILDTERSIVGVVMVFQDATERRRAQKELRLARDEALAASRAKDNFLAALSHELRTPLNPVLLIASDAAGNARLPESVRADFETIVKNVSIEARLIDDLLDITGISRGKMMFDMRRLDLRTVIQEAFAKVQDDLDRKKLRYSADLGTEACWIHGDAARLQQVFWNVLKNSVKFTPVDGTITLKIERKAGASKVAVLITDSGIGMTPGEMSRIFNFFQQGDHAASRASHRFGGLGLGLAISKMITEAHEGTISAESAGPDRGCTLRVTLPLASHEELKQGIALDSYRPGGNAIPTGKVLVVEDHEPTREVLIRLLEDRGFTVLGAPSVVEAIGIAERETLDFAISDLGLPDGDGYELMARLRQRGEIRGIALSGYGMAADVRRSRQAGFVAHLTKPVTIESLEAALAKVGVGKFGVQGG